MKVIMAVEGEVTITIKGLFVQLNMMKRNFERGFSGLRSDIESFRLELQNDLFFARKIYSSFSFLYLNQPEDLPQKHF